MDTETEDRAEDIAPQVLVLSTYDEAMARKRGRDEKVQAILSAGFLLDELEWKVQTSGKNDRGLWARVVPYVTSRAIIERLDEAFGPGGYSVQVQPFEVGGHQGFKATIAAGWPSHNRTTREDVSDLPKNEPLKGGASGAIKRAAVLYGIGRYLYTSPDFYAVIHDQGEHRGVFNDKRTNEQTFYRWSLPREAYEWVEATQRSLAAHREATATGPLPTSAASTGVPTAAPAPSRSSAPSSSPTASPPPSRPATTAAPATPSSPSGQVMPGRDGWFKGWAGKPITDVPVEVLEESRAYYAKRISDNPTDKWINKTKSDLAAIEAELLTRDQGGSEDGDFPEFGDNPFDNEAPDDLPY